MVLPKDLNHLWFYPSFTFEQNRHPSRHRAPSLLSGLMVTMVREWQPLSSHHQPDLYREEILLVFLLYNYGRRHKVNYKTQLLIINTLSLILYQCTLSNAITILKNFLLTLSTWQLLCYLWWGDSGDSCLNHCFCLFACCAAIFQ